MPLIEKLEHKGVIYLPNTTTKSVEELVKKKNMPMVEFPKLTSSPKNPPSFKNWEEGGNSAQKSII